jgi:hypothetical protein
MEAEGPEFSFDLEWFIGPSFVGDELQWVTGK